jgi:hypothetical protein
VALAGPFLVQFVLAPLILQSRVDSSIAVLLSQGMLLMMAATVIAVTLAPAPACGPIVASPSFPKAARLGCSPPREWTP